MRRKSETRDQAKERRFNTHEVEKKLVARPKETKVEKGSFDRTKESRRHAQWKRKRGACIAGKKQAANRGNSSSRLPRYARSPRDWRTCEEPSCVASTAATIAATTAMPHALFALGCAHQSTFKLTRDRYTRFFRRRWSSRMDHDEEKVRTNFRF